MPSTGMIHRRAAGFTMIEILVTLVILMIGLLGIAGMMAQGQRASFEAYQRQQALALANDMAERIKANPVGVDDTVVGATYLAAIGSPVGTGTRFSAMTADCAAANCTTTDLVQYDVAMWDGLLAGAAAETATTGGTAIGPLLNPRGCVQLVNSTACPACGGALASRQVHSRVSVAWQGSFATSSPSAAGETCGTGLYRDPATGNVSDAFRRVVSVEVYTVLPCTCP